jgi:hypothetical protein
VARRLRGGLLLQVGVEIGSRPQLGVTEEHRHLDEFDAGRDEQRGARMPEVVKPHPWRRGGADQRLERSEHVARMEWRADLPPVPASCVRREDQPGLDAISARLQPLFELACPVLAKGFRQMSGSMRVRRLFSVFSSWSTSCLPTR